MEVIGVKSGSGVAGYVAILQKEIATQGRWSDGYLHQLNQLWQKPLNPYNYSVDCAVICQILHYYLSNPCGVYVYAHAYALATGTVGKTLSSH